jgi:YebC/PmpR family DNA-binding regulatory protein
MGRAFEYRKERKFKRWAAMSKAFTRIGKEIMMAVKAGGPNPDTNSRLKIAIQNAKGVNMPKQNIENAIKKASSKEYEDYDQVLYEGYGPGGVAILVEAATNNTTRTVANLRSYFNKFDGSLGTSGSVSFMFNHVGVFTIPKSLIKNVEEFELEMIDAGVDDIEMDDEKCIITCPFEQFGPVNSKLEELGIEAEESVLNWFPMNQVAVTGDNAIKLVKLLKKIEEDDDVQKVYANYEMNDEIAELFDKE